jgi:hypothetical protein
VSANAKPLNVKSKMSQEHELYKMKCWPFGIVEGCPKDKDERVEEYSWEVVPGMAIRCVILNHYHNKGYYTRDTDLQDIGSCYGRRLPGEERLTSSRAA